MMVDADATRRARLLGGFFARNRVRRKTSAQNGSLVLAGLVDRRIPLRASFKGVRHRATLRKDGHISYQRAKYDSPTAAARSIVGRQVNGWKFWTYRHPRKGWIELEQLRR